MADDSADLVTVPRATLSSIAVSLATARKELADASAPIVPSMRVGFSALQVAELAGPEAVEAASREAAQRAAAVAALTYPPTHTQVAA